MRILPTDLEKPDTRPILATVITATLLHLPNISVVAALLCVAMWSYHALSLRRPLPAPGLALKTVAGALLFLVAVLTNDGLTVEAFVSLLSLMIALKLFELRHRRDATIAVILCYFVIVSGMFFSDSLPATAYIVLAVLGNTAVLAHVQHPSLGLRPALRLAGGLALKALPVTLVLFLLFPRVQGGLWGRPSLIEAKSGFSEEIRFGAIARLAVDNEVAFRVEFDGPMPPPEQRYWRGIVLWEFDGEIWRRGEGSRGGLALATGGPTVGYTLTLEPHQRNWLFALDLPVRANLRGAWLNGDHSLQTWRPVTGRISYRGESRPRAQARAQAGPPTRGLQLPPAGNPRARELARSWQQAGLSGREVVERALGLLGSGDFRYTLEPGAADQAAEAVDRFLFDTRAGFCEHFAGSFAFLLRASGVPVRLVGGYLGGRVNPLGGHLVVRQADAHVWCEVLLDGSWQRIDPTAAAAPRRLQATADELLGGGGTDSPFALLSFARLPAWLQPLANTWDLVDSRWNRWVMEYSFADQVQLLRLAGLNVGIGRGAAQVLVVGAGLLAAGWFLVLALVRPQNRRMDTVARDWRRFCAALARAGLERRPHQGPISLLHTVRAARPDLADQAEAIIDLYVGLRYRGRDDEATRTAFHRAVQRFTPPPAAG